MVSDAIASDADGGPDGQSTRRRPIATATPPHRVDTEQGSSAQLGPDAEPGIPQPLPHAERRGSRMAVAVMLAALAIIVLVVLL